MNIEPTQNIAEKRIPNEKKPSKKKQLEALKREWCEKQESLLKEKETLGFGDYDIDDFLGYEVDEDESYDKTAPILALQRKLRELQEKRHILWGEDSAIEELNKKHAVVHTSQFFIMTEKDHPVFTGTTFTLESKQSFKDTYENQLVLCADGKERSKAEVWLKSPKRRQYKGITFSPGRQTQDKDLYNLWRGFSVEPKQGSCALFKEHMRRVICGGNEVYFNYLWKWCARLFQSPHLLAETVPVLMGEPGTGKNTFVEGLGYLLMGGFVPLDGVQQLVGNFNFHLKEAVLIHGNEAMWGGNKKELGRLKSMITEPYKAIEPKGKDVIFVPNYTHLIISSNEDWPVHIDRNDRRFFVLNVSSAHKEDLPYFKAIKEELRNGGREALLYELLHEDISDFDPRIIPSNNEAFSVKMESAGSTEKYIYAALREGHFNIGNAAPFGAWKEKISVDSVFTDYESWCLSERLGPKGKAAFGKILKKLIPLVEKIRPRSKDIGERTWEYEFGNLESVRRQFEKSFKVDQGIWDWS
ncbi:DUF5906 domain-containing protein [Estrella lausannensis]|uniref:NrS-1 polymerase-like helicase domain-containing protein n=1 Tax=Estrella lausannensis TaxID=483423 RepID=A0A0H5E8B6_9BACT|nr:DUF5906 domain-containing protein [Estrella lausannensis]CRX39580.1 hypothetical protein ELAC_p0003 [Estrella lausannensis]